MPLRTQCSWSDADLGIYRDSVVRFITTEMQPQDEAARQRGHVGHALWRQAGALGFLCADIPVAYGGAGGDFRHEAVFYEEMARRGLTGMSTSVHAIVAHHLLNHGTEDQKQRHLPRRARGELEGAIAMTEPGAGSDLQGIRTRAQRQGWAGRRKTPRSCSSTFRQAIAGQQNTKSNELLQLFGGYGYLNDYLIARMYADARVQRIYGGTSEIMKEVISRSL